MVACGRDVRERHSSPADRARAKDICNSRRCSRGVLRVVSDLLGGRAREVLNGERWR